MKLLGLVDPPLPRAIAYMLGDETWLPPEKRTPRRIHVEEWGNLGPMELDPEIQPNAAGFRVRSSDRLAPPGALGFTRSGDVAHWTDVDEYGHTAEQRAARSSWRPTTSAAGEAHAPD